MGSIMAAAEEKRWRRAVGWGVVVGGRAALADCLRLPFRLCCPLHSALFTSLSVAVGQGGSQCTEAPELAGPTEEEVEGEGEAEGAGGGRSAGGCGGR